MGAVSWVCYITLQNETNVDHFRTQILEHHKVSLIYQVIIKVTLTMDFTGGLDSKASAYNVGDLGSIPGLGRSPGEGNGNLLQ